MVWCDKKNECKNYNNGFINFCKDCKFNNIPKYNHFIKNSNSQFKNERWGKYDGQMQGV